MEFIKISIIILIAVVIVGSLPLFDKGLTALITISTCVIVVLYVMKSVSPAIETIKNIVSNQTTVDFTIVFKSMGISLITQFVSDVAMDNGNKALANQMTFVGKIAIVMLAMPVFVQVLEVIGQFIK